MKQIQNYGMRIITSSSRWTPSETLREVSYTGWHCHNDVRSFSYHSSTGAYMVGLQSTSAPSRCGTGNCNTYARTWGQNNIHLGRPCTNFYQNSFEFQTPSLWNQFPSELKNSAAFNRVVGAHTVLWLLWHYSVLYGSYNQQWNEFGHKWTISNATKIVIAIFNAFITSTLLNG